MSPGDEEDDDEDEDDVEGGTKRAAEDDDEDDEVRMANQNASIINQPIKTHRIPANQSHLSINHLRTTTNKKNLCSEPIDQ